MDDLSKWNSNIQKPEKLSLELRLENAGSFSISNPRSIEARFRAIGFCKILYYFPSKERSESFIRYVSSKCSCQLSYDATYAEVASKIYELYKSNKKNSDAIATKLMFLLINPIVDISNATHTASNRKLLQNPSVRGYVLYVHDFNRVINSLYPELLHQDNPPYLYRHRKELQSETLLSFLYQGFEYIKNTKHLMKIQKDSQGTRAFTEEQVKVRENYQCFVHSMKELFIDPFHCLWEEEQKLNKKQKR